MSHKNRKPIRLDLVKEKQQRNLKSLNQQYSGSLSGSKGSSDFSEFQMPSKDINQNFTPFQIPIKFKQSSNYKQIKQKQNRNIKPGNIYTNKDKIKSQSLQKQKSNSELDFDKQIENYGISFNQNEMSPKQFKNNSSSKQGNAKIIEQDEEELITQYDKKQFNNKSLQKQVEIYEKNLERSRKENRQKVLSESGLLKTVGGVCFEVDLKDFVQAEPKQSKKRKKKIKKKRQALNINSNEEILKRRQDAFRYGEYARKKTFGRF